MNQKVAEVYRMTITSDDILGTLELLSCIPLADMPTGARNLQKKFQLQAAKINIGAATPAYVTTGHKKAVEISLESLGGEDEANHTIRNLAAASVANPLQSPKIGANLNESEEEELARLEREMLQGLAAQGSDNVILEDRRKIPRTTDNFDISQL